MSFRKLDFNMYLSRLPKLIYKNVSLGPKSQRRGSKRWKMLALILA